MKEFLKKYSVLIFSIALIVVSFIYMSQKDDSNKLKIKELENKNSTIQKKIDSISSVNLHLKDSIVSLDTEIETLKINLEKNQVNYDRKIRIIQKNKDRFDNLGSDAARDSVLRAYIRSNQRAYRSQ